MSVSCVSVTVWAEENAEEQTEEAEDSSNSEGEEDADLEESDNPEIEEGYTTELEGVQRLFPGVKMGIIFTDSSIIQQILTDQNLSGNYYEPWNWFHFPDGRACKNIGKQPRMDMVVLYI